jgi:hypothetical protein
VRSCSQASERIYATDVSNEKVRRISPRKGCQSSNLFVDGSELADADKKRRCTFDIFNECMQPELVLAPIGKDTDVNRR